MIQVVRHIEELEEAVARVRKCALSPSTNLFASREQLAAWQVGDELFYAAEEGSVVILRPDRDFHRVYHVSADSESLGAQLRELGDAGGTLVVDLVGRPAQVGAVADVYASHGFQTYRSLFRMGCSGNPVATCEVPDLGVELAVTDDIPEVRMFFERLLDPYVDRIPDDGDLQGAVIKRNVLLVRESGSLSGVLAFENTGMTALLRYWYVAQEARGRGTGARLMKTFFRLCHDARRFVLWVADGNEDSIAKYRHYGFRREELLDQIMLRRAA